MLSTVNRLYGLDEGYKLVRNWKHGCVVWLYESLGNVLWMRDMMKCLNDEYCYRYGASVHAAYLVIKRLSLPPIDNRRVTYPYLAMPEKYVQRDFVEAYRSYYRGDKAYFAKWSKRSIPYWW
ncbi:hypothetical protein Elgi_69150 [Paenibacillus elgii]|nr:hypothetical protein Elgi_69150 [Paenibacillus elgii]